MRSKVTATAPRGLKLPERYEIRLHIASGGMASVWCAEDLVLGRTVAIKILAERFAQDQLAVHRFMREARAAARVSSHPHVVTIYDVGEATLLDGEHGRNGGDDGHEGDDGPAPGPAFIVMEYLPGGTVSEALRAGPIRREEAMAWLADAASALDHAHAQGIVHRDIKPANFLLDQNRTLFVADFGIARLLSEDTITNSGELFGTAAYISPEQARGRPATDASDRYALAVAAFELLVGSRPFTGEHMAAQARQHIEDQPPRASDRNRDLPRTVDAVLERGMAKRAEDRFPTAGAFVDGLKGALGASRAPRALPATAVTRPWPTSSERTPPPVAFSPARSRRSGRAAAVAALLAAVLVVALVAALSGGSTPSVKQLSAHRGRTSARAGHAHKPRAASPTSASSTTSSTAASSSASPPATASTPQVPAAPQTADQLEAQGHQLLAQGAYTQAIPTLRRAVAAASPGSLQQGYALYDLGSALFQSGDPAAAVPILEQRMQINDQLPTVRKLLDAALAASGQGPSGGAGASAPQPGPGNGHGKGHGGNGD
jgi:eukaryotic-like serine/threonine-protein kinase